MNEDLLSATGKSDADDCRNGFDYEAARIVTNIVSQHKKQLENHLLIGLFL